MYLYSCTNKESYPTSNSEMKYKQSNLLQAGYCTIVEIQQYSKTTFLARTIKLKISKVMYLLITFISSQKYKLTLRGTQNGTNNTE